METRFSHEGSKTRRNQCISQISKCKLQDCGMAIGHNLLFLNFDEVVKSVKSRLCERSEATSQFIPV